MPIQKISTLRQFLSLPFQSEAVFDKFSELPGALDFPDGNGARFLYVPGNAGRPLLCAHADVYAPYGMPLEEDDERFFRACDLLGADDRAGCAILWMLRHTKCPMLIFDGEERGLLASSRFCREMAELGACLRKKSPFVLSFDLAGSGEWKHYGCASVEFQTKISRILGKAPLTPAGATDAALLGKLFQWDVCNLSVGFHHAHTTNEFLGKSDFLAAMDYSEKIIDFF